MWFVWVSDGVWWVVVYERGGVVLVVYFGGTDGSDGTWWSFQKHNGNDGVWTGVDDDGRMDQAESTEAHTRTRRWSDAR